MPKKRSNAGSTSRMEQILVADPTLALATGSLLTATTALGITNGQLGIMSLDHEGATPANDFITAGTTGAQVKRIKVVQGGPKAGATHTVSAFEEGEPAKIESGIIYEDMIQSVSTMKPKVEKYGVSGYENVPAIVSQGTYNLQVTLHSVRNDRDWGDGEETMSEVVEAPAVLPAAPEDLVVKQMVQKFNSRSKIVSLSNSAGSRKGTRNIVALAVSKAGAAGQAIGAIATGASFPIQIEGGVTTLLEATPGLVHGLAQYLEDSALVTATSTIEVVDLTTAGAAVGADAIILVGLPATESVYADNIEQKMTSVQVNPGGDFIDGQVAEVTHVFPNEGTGQGRKWDIESKRRYQQNVHTMQLQPAGEFFSQGYSAISSSAAYTSMIIDYYDFEDTLTHSQPHPKQLIILVPADVAGIDNSASGGQDLSANTVTAVQAQIGAGTPAYDPQTFGAVDAALEASLGAWIKSASSYVETGGDSTQAAMFAV